MTHSFSNSHYAQPMGPSHHRTKVPDRESLTRPIPPVVLVRYRTLSPLPCPTDPTCRNATSLEYPIYIQAPSGSPSCTSASTFLTSSPAPGNIVRQLPESQSTLTLISPNPSRVSRTLTTVPRSPGTSRVHRSSVPTSSTRSPGLSCSAALSWLFMPSPFCSCYPSFCLPLLLLFGSGQGEARQTAEAAAVSSVGTHQVVKPGVPHRGEG